VLQIRWPTVLLGPMGGSEGVTAPPKPIHDPDLVGALALGKLCRASAG